MNDLVNNWRVQVLGTVAIAGVTVAVFWAVEGFESAWPVAFLFAAFIAILHFGRQRSNVLEVMSGTGDERVRTLYMRALAITGSVMSFVLPGWWLVTLAQGEADPTLSALCAIFGVTFLAAAAVLARRS
jgi:hypothetical protein